MKIKVGALESLRKAEGFKAVMIGTIIMLSAAFWMADQLLDKDWLAGDLASRRVVVGLIIVLLICCMGIAIKWQSVNRAAFKSKHVFVGMPSLDNEPFHVELLNGIVQSLTPEYTVTFWLPRAHQEYKGSAFQEFLTLIKNDSANYVGGIVLPTVVDHERPEKLVEITTAIDLPVVLVDTLPDAFVEKSELPKGHSFIGFDNTEGGRLAAKALVRELPEESSDPGRILVLHAKEQTDRHLSFVEEVPKLCPRLSCSLIECGWRRDRAREAVQGLAEAGTLDEFEGIFACNDEMAVGAIEALSAADNSSGVERNIVVVGYDGSPTALALLRMGSTPLRNVVVQSGYNLGLEAASRLRALVRAKHESSERQGSKPFLLKPELYHRVA